MRTGANLRQQQHCTRTIADAAFSQCVFGGHSPASRCVVPRAWFCNFLCASARAETVVEAAELRHGLSHAHQSVYGGTTLTARPNSGRSTTVASRARACAASQEQWLGADPGRARGLRELEQFERIQALDLREICAAVEHSVGRHRARVWQPVCCAAAAAAISSPCATRAVSTTLLRYSCYRGWLDNGEPRCIAFGGLLVDEALARELLRVVQPAAIEAARLHARTGPQAGRCPGAPAAAIWRPPAMRRAGCQEAIRRCDPENRLIADELRTTLEPGAAACRGTRSAHPAHQRERRRHRVPAPGYVRRNWRINCRSCGTIPTPTRA